MRVLYITHNGLADYIGQSQVLPYLLGLARAGFEITVISAEKAVNASVREGVSRQTSSVGIEWHFVSYHNWPPLVSTVFDLYRMYRMGTRIMRTSSIGLIHCRSFLPQLVGIALKRLFGVPLVFDFRDFWADRGIYGKPFKFVYRYFKRREGSMIRNSDHVVTLTAKAREILHHNYLQDLEQFADGRITVIPTCADLALFDTRNIVAKDRLAIRTSLGIDAGDVVFGYLGTFHEDYIPAKMFQAFLVLRSLEAGAKFLFVSPNGKEEILHFAKQCGVNEEEVRVVSALRSEVPKYLAIFDLSVVFVRADPSTAGVSPTKLAELFSCNIPVLANAGVGDVDRIVNPELNDSVLVCDFTDATLRSAIGQLLKIMRSPERHGRSDSMKFSLAEGIRRYQTVYSRYIQPTSVARLTEKLSI